MGNNNKRIIQELPNSWLIVLLIISLTILRAFNIDSFTTAGLGLIIGYVTGKHVEQTRTEI